MYGGHPGEVRGAYPWLTFYSGERAASPSRLMPALAPSPGAAPPFTSRLGICMSLRPSPYCSLYLEHPSLPRTPGSFSETTQMLASLPPLGTLSRAPEENLDPCPLWVTAAFSPASFPTPGKHFNSQLSGVETVWLPEVANLYGYNYSPFRGSSYHVGTCGLSRGGHPL